ncbi:hypothetical protein HPP92_022226 [Vanilla planifolia]|uniref:Ionotropic glutamate receptor C-terminal domain-containing protein n=1 Tax=Vanilla planifolia TaxID=51239 RepID=A0A835UF80_VANPL|nr:hypothetical protein HPP92_022226 [Vanilla planifolia]
MKGYCLDVFLAAVNLLPYPLLYRFIPFGNGYENPNYTELVEKVASNEFDAAVGDIAIVAARTKIVDFTQPYIESGLVILASVREIESIIGAVIWILEHRFNDEFRGSPKRQLGTIFWFSFSTLFSSPKNTVSTLGRFVLLVWLFVVLIVQSSYIASLTSILTVRQLYSPIRGLDSIIEGKDPIGYQVGSFSEKYLIEELGIPSSRLKVLHNPDEYARSLVLGPERGGVMAIVDELPYVELFMSTNCKFTIVGRGFTTSGWGFAFPRDSQLAIDMSTAILKLSESGELQRIHDKWLIRSSCSSESTEIISSQLDLHSFWALFAICGVACFLALLAYFIKIIRQFIQYFPLDEPETEPEGSSKSFGSKSGKILQSFISFADEKQEDKTARSRRRQAQSARGSTVDIETEEVPASVN